MSYKIGDRVVAVKTIHQPASEDLPAQDLCDVGDVLEVRRLNDTSWSLWPVAVAHPHREPEAMFGVSLDEIRPG